MNRRNLIKFVLALAVMFSLSGWVHAQNAQSLKNNYQRLQDKLKNNQFNQPIVMDSEQTSKSISGDVYSVINYPFSTVRTALDTPEEWCDVLSLHLNVKYCRALNSNKIEVYAGTKKPQPLSDAFHMEYNFKPVINNTNYMQIVMDAKSGPMGTSDYYMMMEAIPIQNNQTFIHVKYSYHYAQWQNWRPTCISIPSAAGKEGFIHYRQKTGRKTEIRIRYERRNRTQYHALLSGYRSLSGFIVSSTCTATRNIA